MADQLDINTRSQNPDDEIDDPLAELARIIGYERPADSARTSVETPDANEFDLEAELMRELDVPLAPSVDELDLIEADEALDQALADGEFETDPAETMPPQQDELLVRQMFVEEVSGENIVDDRPDVEPADNFPEEGRSSGALLQAIENEFPVETLNEANFGELSDDEDDLVLAWDDDLASDWLADRPAFEDEDHQADHEEPTLEAESPITAEFGAVHAAAVTRHAGDDVLEDIVRFELPLRGADISRSQAVPTDGAVPIDGADIRPDDDADHGAVDQGDDDTVRAGFAAESSMDFEEYLSTELDVFGHEVALDADDNRTEGTDQLYGNHQDDEIKAEPPLDALNDDPLDDDPAVFDDAAEELLASLTVPDEFSEPAPKAEPAEVDEPQGWSLDTLEESTAAELDDELGDMFALPDRVVDPTAPRAEEPDDLELDLGQVLADSFNETNDDELVGMTAGNTDVDHDIEPDDRRYADEQGERDTMTEAFVGLMPAAMASAPEPSPKPQSLAEEAHPSANEEQPEQDDWLAGFDESGIGSTDSAPHSDDDDYYFDADLIADADETVEAVGVIDVPELVQDDPQTLEPDYDTDIEREFADIAERHEPRADESSEDVIDSDFGSAEVWSRTDGSPRSHEVSDDYIALERELGVDHEHPVERYAAPFSGDDHLTEDDYSTGETARPGSRGPVLAVAVLGVALLAVAGAFGWSMFSDEDTSADGGPRIIRADKDPVKVLPENPGGVTVPNQDKAVYDRVAGVDSAAPGQPALVNSAEEPMDVVQRTLDPEILPLEGRGEAAVKSEERLTSGMNSADVEASGASGPVVSPRKVRTMIVKPDGSIVAREDPEPAAEAVDSQQAVASAGTILDAPTEAPAGLEPTAADAPLTTIAETAEAAEAAEAGPASIAPVRVVKTQPIRPVANAPVPAGRPAEQPVNVVGTVSQGGTVSAAPTAPAAAATPAAQPVEVASAPAAAAPAANPGGYYVQIASQPTAEGAQASWRTLSNRYSSVLGGNSVDIQRADIPGKGVFHRVRVPAGTKDQANALCSRYKAAGGSCFVSR